MMQRRDMTFREPDDNDPFNGKVALESLEVMPTVSELLTRFQSASTERTVALNDVPSPWAAGVPVLPEAVPGAAVSPGTNSCSFAKAAAFTVMEELVLAVLFVSVVRSEERR